MRIFLHEGQITCVHCVPSRKSLFQKMIRVERGKKNTKREQHRSQPTFSCKIHLTRLILANLRCDAGNRSG